MNAGVVFGLVQVLQVGIVCGKLPHGLLSACQLRPSPAAEIGRHLRGDVLGLGLLNVEGDALRVKALVSFLDELVPYGLLLVELLSLKLVLDGVDRLHRGKYRVLLCLFRLPVY